MTDFLTELRAELVEADAQYGRHTPVRRATRTLHPRMWRPSMVLAAAATAACALALVVGVGALRGPEPTVVPLRILTIVRVGGVPQDAASGHGSLWIANFAGDVARVDPVHRRVTARIPIGGEPHSLAVGATGVWVTIGSDTQGARLLRIDPRSGRVTARVKLPALDATVAAGPDVIWVADNHDTPSLAILRVDPTSTRTLTTAPVGFAGHSMAAAGDSVWVLDGGGAVHRLDPASGRPVRRVPRVGDQSTSGDDALVADGSGAWVVAPGRGALARVQGDRVTRRIPLPRGALPVLAVSDGAVWVAHGDGLRGGYWLDRIDPQSGRIAGRVRLGAHRPNALVPAAGGVWIAADDGTAIRVGAGR